MASSRIFTAEEKQALIDLIARNGIIKDKRGDVMTLAKKKKAWEEIAMAFNSKAKVTKRTVRQLKKCWVNMKSRRKKESVDEARTRSKTGGGPSGPDVGAFPDIDAVAPHTMHLIGYHFDNDAVEGNFAEDIPGIPFIPEDKVHDGAWATSETPRTTARASKRVAPTAFKRTRLLQNVVDARVRILNAQLEQEKQLFQLKLEERRYLMEVARLNLSMMKEKKEMEWKAFEAEERRKEELHEIKLHRMKFSG